MEEELLHVTLVNNDHYGIYLGIVGLWIPIHFKIVFLVIYLMGGDDMDSQALLVIVDFITQPTNTQTPIIRILQIKYIIALVFPYRLHTLSLSEFLARFLFLVLQGQNLITL